MAEGRLNLEELEQRIAPDLLTDIYLDDGTHNPVPAGATPQPSGANGTNPVPEGATPQP